MIKKLALRLRTLLEKYERQLAAAAILIGFTIDSHFLTRIDLWWNNLVLLSYIVIVAVGIVIFHMVEEHALKGWVADTIGSLMPIVVQFAFGNLFSGLIIFYGRSASIATSWIFVVILALLLLVSEAFNKNYQRFRYQVSLLFFFLLAYNAFYVPVLLGQIGPWVFFLSVAISLVIIVAFLALVSQFLPKKIKRTRSFITRAVLIIAAIFSLLYVVDAIPPLPLTLTEASVAHSIVRTGDSYQLSVEPSPWYESWYRTYNTEFHRTTGGAVYVYSSVFAPRSLSITLQHEWQYLDVATKKWRTSDIVSFPVSGGRDGGFRGYTMKSSVHTGKWRVNVNTSYGAVLGRVEFTVHDATNTPVLIPVLH